MYYIIFLKKMLKNVTFLKVESFIFPKISVIYYLINVPNYPNNFLI